MNFNQEFNIRSMGWGGVGWGDIYRSKLQILPEKKKENFKNYPNTIQQLQ